MSYDLRLTGWRRGLATALVLWFGLPGIAYPPAPHHRFHGMVRDELGDPLNLPAAEVFLETTSGLQVKTKVVPDLAPGQNYSLSVAMDAGATADLYQPTALRPTLPFKLKVRVGSVTYLPIEMSGNYASLGQPGQSTRIDLTLGEDSDGDGLPDAWERLLIAASGGNLTLQDINPNDDFDGDGLSNLQEYISGNYAFDPADGFRLQLIRREGKPFVEFMAIRGRSYTILASSDLKEWSPVPFSVGTGGETPAMYYRATDVRVVQAAIAGEQPQWRYFKLMAQ